MSNPLASAGTGIKMAGGVFGAVGAIKKGKEGKQMQEEARAKIDNFKWQELDNAYDNLSVSTMGSDLQREENSRFNAGAVNAMRGGGSRAVLGGMGALQQNNNLMNRRIGANLDQQQKSIDMAGAQRQGQIQNMVEQRQSNELQGYGQMMNVGMQMKYQKYSDLMNIGNMMGEQLTEEGDKMTEGLTKAFTGGMMG